MRAFPILFIVGITMAATAPAAAQRFAGNAPVCLQRWQWGGSSTISCQYQSWDGCRASAAGLSAMCLQNPYAQQPSRPDRGVRHR